MEAIVGVAEIHSKAALATGGHLGIGLAAALWGETLILCRRSHFTPELAVQDPKGKDYPVDTMPGIQQIRGMKEGTKEVITGLKRSGG